MFAFDNKLRKIIYVAFFLLAFISIVILLYWIYLIILAVGFVGGEIEIVEVIWELRAPFMISLYLCITSIGFYKKRKFGIYFGVAATICFLLLVLVYSFWIKFNFYNILFIILCILTLLGFYRIKDSFGKLTNKNYLAILALVIFLFIVFIEFFFSF